MLRGQELTALVGVMVLGGLLVFGFAGRLSARTIGAMGLVIAFVGAFYLYIVIAPSSPMSAVASVALFLGSAILFRLLSSFREPPLKTRRRIDGLTN